MTQDTQDKLSAANNAKAAYAVGQLTKEEALEHVKPYVDTYNEIATRIADEFQSKPKLLKAYPFLKSPIR